MSRRPTGDRQPQPRHLALLRFSSDSLRAGLPLNDNHPVLQAMRQRLADLRQRYEHHPCEFNRYQLVRQEQRLAQVRPDGLVTV